jgi:mRNA interferase YafQ
MFKKNFTGQFKRDYKAAIKRGLDIQLLDDIIRQLCIPTSLPEHNKDHLLSGNWVGHKECHIQADWLLIYRYDGADTIVFVRTGSHSDLF